MQIKDTTLKIKGMNKDLSYSAFNPEFSWDNHNIRLTARDGNDLMSITNEKGNLQLIPSILSSQQIISGKCIGTCVLNKYLILFTTDSTLNISVGRDRIYKVELSNDDISYLITLLYKGTLFFDQNSTIQTLPFYENETIQKVYWIDGINQPRVINVIDTTTNVNPTSVQFDFIQELKLLETVTVTKQFGGGIFKSGIIQYAFTYFNKNGSESNIFQVTPINYISPEERGGKIDELVQNSFKININYLESQYEYVRIYSIYRTSLNTTPEVRSVIDLKIPINGIINYVDNNSHGSIVSSDLLLYVGGEELIPQCMSQKNNTLFLGNISLKDAEVTPATLITTSEVDRLDAPLTPASFYWENNAPIELENSTTGNSAMYPYKPTSLKSNNLKHFKFDETYRFGIQGQYKNGKWSSPIWLGDDYKVDKRYKTDYNGTDSVMVTCVKGRYDISTALSLWLKDTKHFIKVRPVMVPLAYTDRTIIAQGIVNNTLAVVKNRYIEKSTSKFAYPDYMFRTNGKTKSVVPTFDGQYSHFDLLKLNNNLSYDINQDPNRYIENMANGDSVDFSDLSDTRVFAKPFNDQYNRDFFFVDRNIVNFWSPEIAYNSEIVNNYIKNVKSVGLYGFAFQTALNSKFEIDFGDKPNSTGSDPILYTKYNYYKGGVSLDSDRISRMFVYLDSKGGDNFRNWTNIPIWSPKDLVFSLPQPTDGLHHSSDMVVNFTKLNKSGLGYFGINSTLLDNMKYELDINNPSLIFNDSDMFYKTNNEDNSTNGGNIIYSKSVDKNYPSGKYYNTFKFGSGDTNTLRYSQNSDYGRGPGNVPPNAINSGLSMKYNTSSHVLFSFKKQLNGYFACMPKLKNLLDSSTEYYKNPLYRSSPANDFEFRCDVLDPYVYISNPITIGDTAKNSLPIFDLYSGVTTATRYGGQTASAIYSNNWIPCGGSVRTDLGAVSLYYTDGDTYIQRFDFLRVFPNDLNQIPQHTEIVSFLCESFINIDGRSDVNRYNTDSSLMTPTNYGLINNVYSQRNNFFNYNILDPLLFATKNFNNTIVWTKTKISGGVTDNWTNISMLNSMDLDGVNGEVASINIFNNDLYAFQKKGIARLLYNERVQQQASDGVSVELTNGYKVPDYRYLTNQYGCSNKSSIIECKNGIYFIDYTNKSLVSIGDGIKDISASSGFKSWFNTNTKDKNYTLSYDRKNNDLYIHDNSLCLNYSESLQSFVSFYDYINTNRMKNIWDDFISINSELNVSGNFISKIWLQNKGDYNSFYGNIKPFSVEYLLNPEPLVDKVFNTIEYRLDQTDIDWNNLSLQNWYQIGTLSTGKYADRVKRKFNVNRVQLPRRDKSLDRIRSTWVKLKLSHILDTTNSNSKLNMQDLTITYTI